MKNSSPVQKVSQGLICRLHIMLSLSALLILGSAEVFAGQLVVTNNTAGSGVQGRVWVCITYQGECWGWDDIGGPAAGPGQVSDWNYMLDGIPALGGMNAYDASAAGYGVSYTTYIGEYVFYPDGSGYYAGGDIIPSSASYGSGGAVYYTVENNYGTYYINVDCGC